MESSKQLDKMLSDFQHNALCGGFVDSKEIGDKIVEVMQNDPDAPPLAKFLGSLGNGESIIAVSRYWQFRDEIREYQKHNNISSVIWDSVEWKGEVIRYPNYNDQLEFLPQDGAILSRHKDKTVAKYLDFISRHNLEMILDDESLEDYAYVGHEYVLNAAQEYDYAWLGHGFTNQPVYDGINRKNKILLYYFTEYPLCLTDYPNDDDNQQCMWIKAIVKTDII